MSSPIPAKTLRARVSQAYASQSREAAEERLIVSHLPLVRHIAQKVCSQVGNGLEMEDLISAGTLGLVQAAKGFDPARDTEFMTYAYIRVRGAIMDEIRTHSFVPAAAHKQMRRVENAYQKLFASAGRPPEDEELAQELGVPLEQLYRTLQEARRQHFLSIHGMSEDEPAFGCFLPVAEGQSPEAHAQRKELIEKLAQAIKDLPKTDRTVLLLYYERDLTMKETAQVLGVTESRVSQLHASALLKLFMKLRTAQ